MIENVSRKNIENMAVRNIFITANITGLREAWLLFKPILYFSRKFNPIMALRFLPEHPEYS